MVADDDREAVVGQPQRTGRADPRTTAGDEGDRSGGGQLDLASVTARSGQAATASSAAGSWLSVIGIAEPRNVTKPSSSSLSSFGATL
jgi:hypothetical protein